MNGVREAVREDARGDVVVVVGGGGEGDLAGEGLEEERPEGEDVVGGVGAAAADDWAAAAIAAAAADSVAAFPEHLRESVFLRKRKASHGVRFILNILRPTDYTSKW